MNELLNNKTESFLSSPVKLSSNHLLAIEGMKKSEIQNLIDRADYFANLDRHSNTKTLQGYVVLNVFFVLNVSLVLKSERFFFSP